VNDAASIPLFADAKLVELLRHEYLQNNMPEEAGDFGPKAPSNQLAGSAYDRTTYGFRIATRPEQDDELIRILNSAPNSEAYALFTRNCADFAKQIVNFYYPHAIHRSIIADLGVTTPKQAAKSLVHSAKHHPEMQLTTFVIPQVPGLKRSKPATRRRVTSPGCPWTSWASRRGGARNRQSVITGSGITSRPMSIGRRSATKAWRRRCAWRCA
jgi:hypothetical protein